MKLSLPRSVASPQDLAALVQEVREYGAWYVHESLKQRVTHSPSNAAQPVLSSSANELIRTWFNGKTPARAGFDALVHELEQAVKNPHLVTITLAAAAPNSLKTSLVEWFRLNVASDMLVSFQINSTILGGMVVRSGSHVFDWSFRRRILEEQHTFPEILRNVR